VLKEIRMFEIAQRTIEFLSDLPPKAFIAAVLLALVFAVATAGTYRWLAIHRPDATTLLVCLILIANLACALTTVGFVQSRVPTVRLVERGGRPPRDRIISLYDHVAQPGAIIGSGTPSAEAP
jgi:hypothetical protein